MLTKMMISVTILTKNSAATLKKCLLSLSGFPEVILYDTGSTDETLSIAREFPHVRICQGFFDGFGTTHNRASALATHDWILSLDSDEALTPALAQEILSLKLDSSCVYKIRRHNFFNGKRIRYCGGWDPDFVVRLFSRKTATFTEAKVHEKVITDNLKTVRLQNPLLHTPYLQISDFLTKMQNYSTLFAQDKKQKKRAGVGSALLHSFWAFFKSYILKRGFLAGNEGLIISLYNGHTALYKYLKLFEVAEQARRAEALEKQEAPLPSSTSRRL